jgi:Xaa-Pro dipeptidase
MGRYEEVFSKGDRTMTKVKIILVFFCVFFFVLGLNAQNKEPDADAELMHLIRSEKLDLILPQAMRDNGIDMWIHVKRGKDPLNFELGCNPGVFIFTDRGGKRIERAILGGRGDRKLYDIFASENNLAQFVTERDPKRIAVNYSEERSDFNTIPPGDYSKLMKALGDTYAKRMVPADHLIADFLAGRVMSEIALFGRLSMISAELIEKEFDKIVPGVTKLSDLNGNVFLRDPDGHEENNTDYVIQRGDLIGLLHDANMMDFREHNGGIAYVLREGETDLPPEVKKIWEHALKCREIFRRNIKSGSTGAETLEILIRKLEEAGYVYIDRDEYDRNADPEKTQVHIDFHALGRIISQEYAPRISPTGWGRDLKIPLYHTFTFEYMIHMPVPEWGKGKHLYICIHDGAMVTERGIEFPYPPIQEIRIIR